MCVGLYLALVLGSVALTEVKDDGLDSNGIESNDRQSQGKGTEEKLSRISIKGIRKETRRKTEY